MSDERQRQDDPFDWPEDGAPPSDEEARAAQAHAERLERLLDGGGAQGDDLASLAGMISRSVHEKPLGEARAAMIMDEALGAASASRRRQRRIAPLIALAAAMLMAVGLTLGIGMQGRHAPPSRNALSAEMLSRSSDALLGKPIVDRAGASRRLDKVFASRMAGFRALRLSQGRSP